MAERLRQHDCYPTLTPEALSSLFPATMWAAKDAEMDLDPESEDDITSESASVGDVVNDMLANNPPPDMKIASTGPTVQTPTGVMYKSTLCSALSRSSRQSAADATKSSNSRLGRVIHVKPSLAFRDSASPVNTRVLRRSSWIIGAFTKSNRSWWELGWCLRVLRKEAKLSSPSIRLDLSDPACDRERFDVLCYWFKETDDPLVFALLSDVDHCYYCASCIVDLLLQPTHLLPLEGSEATIPIKATLQPAGLDFIKTAFELWDSARQTAAKVRKPDALEAAPVIVRSAALIADRPSLSDRPKRTRLLPAHLSDSHVTLS